MDEMFDRLNRIYPDSKFVLISKYNPEHWKNQEYDSSLDKKAALNKWKSKGMINDIDDDSPICELVTTNFQGEYLALYIYHDTKGPRLKTQKDLYVEWLELSGCESCKVKSVPTWFKHELKLHFTYFISPIVNEIGYKNVYYIIDVDDYTDILKSIESNSTYEKMSVEDYKNDIRYKTNDCTEEITKDFEDSVRQKFMHL